jgi:hypothetical protein
MSTSLTCMQRNGILNEWYENICERKAQGITVKRNGAYNVIIHCLPITTGKGK